MTKKEKLATEYIELRKQFDGENFKPGLTDNQIWYLVREFKAYQLETKIEAVQKAIKEKEIRLKKEKFYSTPEGLLYKAEREEIIEQCHNTVKKLKDEFESFVNDTLKMNIGEGWGCHCNFGYNSGNLEIGLLNTDESRKGFTFEFGHDFTIYWDLNGYRSKERFEMNYGTLGSFELDNNSLRPKYLLGMAWVANNKKFLSLLKKKFNEYNTQIMEMRDTRDKVSKELDNPNI